MADSAHSQDRRVSITDRMRAFTFRKPGSRLVAFMQSDIGTSRPGAIYGLAPHAPVLLVFAAMALLPISRMEELPLVVMAVLGARRLWRERGAVFADPRVLLLTAVFLAYWIPILISAFDAVHPEKTWVVVAAMPRYWLAGLFVLGALASPASHKLLWCLSAWLLVAWTVDALFQAVVGYNLLGYPYPTEPIARLNGIFGPNNFKLGPVLALFSPFLIEHARRNWPVWLGFSALLGLAIVVMLTTTRSGWVMLGVVLVSYIAMYSIRRPARALAALCGGVLLLGCVSTTAYHLSDNFHDSVIRTVGVFEGSRQATDRALSLRLPIWETSVAMGADNWINGVGARSYRFAYPAYAAPDDPWVRENEGIGATYAHHLVLEIWSETGVVGLAGFAVIVVLLVRAWRRAPPDRRRLMLPFAIALFAAVFPFNSHYAVYSTVWSITLWWLVMGFCAASANGPEER